ncbi:phosphate/phosphite/phosphonate ABC transporter substrate-binding protein [Natranaerofaba carboxydovora]|uniref:substrate-binding domain-containing protein n=1 Tax=Natranaerofaba carboxydovora TaxID=2742683 RepID=UPI001F1491A5|nr:phosphate/phosphite/phosphonate ABC transporter substrate-binding protein [Natranaerofaba carboxydovora]UMZ73164.1 Phosphate-import protein PhnD [Natranaerofaba carboxydovora]
MKIKNSVIGVLFLVILITILVVALTFSGCLQRGTDKPKIYLSAEKELEYQEEVYGDDSDDGFEEDEDVLRIALASITSPRESLYFYGDLLDLLEDEVDRDVRITQRQTYGETNDMIRQGEADIAFICTYSYVVVADNYNTPIIAVPQVDGKKHYHSYIIARKDLEVEDFSDLEGKSFAFTDPLSNSGRLYPLYRLYQLGTTPEEFFSSNIFTYSHDNSIRSVSKEVVDGAAVDSLIYDYLKNREPGYFENLEIIHKSEPFGIQPIVARPGIDEELKIKLREFFTTLHETSHGREILGHIGFDKFVEGEDSDYDSIRDLADVMGYEYH